MFSAYILCRLLVAKVGGLLISTEHVPKLNTCHSLVWTNSRLCKLQYSHPFLEIHSLYLKHYSSFVSYAMEIACLSQPDPGANPFLVPRYFPMGFTVALWGFFDVILL